MNKLLREKFKQGNKRCMVLFQFAFCCWDKTQTETNLGVGRIYFSFVYSPWLRESKPRTQACTWSQEPKQRLWRKDGYRFAPYGLPIHLFFSIHFSYTAQAHLLRDGPAYCGLGLHIPINNQKVQQGYAQSLVWWKLFLNFSTVFPGLSFQMSSFCNVIFRMIPVLYICFFGLFILVFALL